MFVLGNADRPKPGQALDFLCTV